MSYRRAIAAALLCALPIAHVAAAEAEAAAATVQWVLPWADGTLLEYAAEELTTSDVGERERLRWTSTTTVRTRPGVGAGFVQAWSWRDQAFVVEAGDKALEAPMRALMAGLQETPLEVALDGQGNYVRLHEPDQFASRMRDVARPLVLAQVDAASGDSDVAKADAARRDKGRKATRAQVEDMLEQMLAPQVVEAELARNIRWYNAFASIDIEPGQDYQAQGELPNPEGGAPILVPLTFSFSVFEDDPEDLYVSYRRKIDRDNRGEQLASIVEALLDTTLTDEQKQGVIAVIDEGMFVVQRATGVAEMFESTRTVQVGEHSQVERYRLRLLNGGHGHVWRPDEAWTGQDATGEDATTGGG